jgi:hypothetical protein
MSHVAIFEKYLNIMAIAMAKALINDIKKCKQKKGREMVQKSN